MLEHNQVDWENLCGRYARRGLDGLLPAEQVWITIRELLDAANNGGIIAYFTNSGADNYRRCLESLKLLGAADLAQVLKKVGRLFGANVEDFDVRNSTIDSWYQVGGGGARVDKILENADDVVATLIPETEQMLSAYLKTSGVIGRSARVLKKRPKTRSARR